MRVYFVMSELIKFLEVITNKFYIEVILIFEYKTRKLYLQNMEIRDS